MISIPK